MTKLKDWAWGGGITTALFWMCVYVGLLGLATAWGFHLIAVQRHEGCVARNTASRNGAQVVAESIIEAAGTNVTQEEIDSFLAGVSRRLEKVQVDCP